MKYFKIFFFACLLSLSFVACTNDDAITEPQNVQESESVQNAISQLQTHFDDNGVLIDEANPTGNLVIDFCFEFVYPITLIYNNGATVTVENLGELITVIINSTPELYIVGIEFPFDVIWYNPATNDIEIITINNEQEFIELLESCTFDPCDCPDVVDPVCVEINTPNGGEIITFPNACIAECEGFTEEDFVDCPNDCDCTDEFDPVCVESQGGIIQFDNECLALCEGYTPNDFVDCPTDGCDITNVTVEVGQCDPANNVYVVVIDFEVINATNDTFDVYDFAGNFLGNYPLSSLPLTLEFEQSGANTGGVVVCINDDPNCCAEIAWDPPICDGGECSITNLVADVGECNDPASGTYNVTIDFQANNPDNDHFDLYSINGEFLGFYPLSSLPLTLEFESNGGTIDGVVVCINDNPNCCADITWEPPTCNSGECSITNLAVDVGDCNPAGTYDITIDFAANNPGNDFFDLFRNNEFVGFFELSQLPITLSFEPSGQDVDVIRVCVNDNPDCCAEIEYVVPTCQNDCGCNDEYDPVCVEFGGSIITYHNACYALCDGFTEADFVDCDPVHPCEDCANIPYDPICVEFAGAVLTMYNECYLFCNDFTPNDIVDCN